MSWGSQHVTPRKLVSGHDVAGAHGECSAGSVRLQSNWAEFSTSCLHCYRFTVKDYNQSRDLKTNICLVWSVIILVIKLEQLDKQKNTLKEFIMYCILFHAEEKRLEMQVIYLMLASVLKKQILCVFNLSMFTFLTTLFPVCLSSFSALKKGLMI